MGRGYFEFSPLLTGSTFPVKDKWMNITLAVLHDCNFEEKKDVDSDDSVGS